MKKLLFSVAIIVGWFTLVNANTVHYVADDSTIQAVVTAYTSSPDETDDTPNVTASGSTTAPGTLACPKKYKFGTQVQIGDAVYTCRDRMNPRYADEERFDVWVYTKTEARVWGKRIVDIKILGI